MNSKFLKIFLLSFLFNSTNEHLISFKYEYNGSFSNLLLKNEYLYIAGTNYVFRLNSKNISKHQNSYKERLINTTILTKNKTQSKNFIKLINWRETNQDIIICGTNLGKPHLYDLNFFDLSNQLEYNGIYLCPGLMELNNLGLITFDMNSKNSKRSINGIMYSAVWNNNEINKKYGIFSRYGIYRKEIEVNRGFLRTLYNPYWLWEPNFIAMLEDSSFVYVFFTEYSIEEYKSRSIENNSQLLLENLSKLTIDSSFNSLVRYSRVASINKNDDGLKIKHLKHIWSSFRKIKIICNCHQNILNDNLKTNNFYNNFFDHLYDSNKYSFSFDNMILTKNLHDDKILSIFYHKFPSFNDKINEYSILCEFNMEDLRNQFKKIESLNRNNFNISIDNNLKDYQIFDGILEDNKSIEDDFNDKSFDFINKNIIIDEEYIGQCKLILPYKIKTFTNYYQSETYQENIFLSGSNSDIIHVTRNETGTYKITDVYNLVDYFYEFSTEHDTLKLNSFKNINEILIDENQIYINTNSFIHQIDYLKLKSISCKKYILCKECIKYSNCKWDENYCMNLNKMLTINEKCFNTTSISSTKILKAEFNQTVILRCDFTEKKEIFWKKNNDLLTSNDSNYLIGKSNELVIFNVRIKDIGIYSCFRSNDNINLLIYNLTVSNKTSYITKFFTVKGTLDYFKNFTKKIIMINNFC
jgi:hypothetical protein